MARGHVTRARAALLLTAAVLVTGNLLGTQSAAAAVVPARQAVVVVLGGISFDEMLSAPAFRRLAIAGGAALMTTKTTNAGTPTAYATIGNGVAESPANLGTPTLLAGALDEAGLKYCEGNLFAAPLYPDEPSILSDPKAPFCSGLRDLVLRFVEVGDFGVLPEGTRREPVLQEGVSAFADLLTFQLRDLPDRETLVMVVTPNRSREMDEVGDEVTPLLMAIGRPGALAASSGHIGALRSNTTRQDGLVSNVDVAPTILDFFDIAIPKQMTGSPIEIDGTKDVFGLHRLHLEQRRIRIPIQIGMLAFLVAIVLLTIGASLAVRVRGDLPPKMGVALRFLLLCVVASYVVALAGGLLPRLTYAVVVPFVVVATLGLALMAVGARWPGTLGPFMFLAAVGLSFVIVDATFFGGRAFRVPLIGGTMFDGARFYGLPNAFTALVLAAAVLLAVPLEPFAGFALIFATGLMVGFPRLGADIGGSITLFAASGLWWVLRTRPRVRVREIGIVAVVVALGLAAVLLVNRFWPGTPTHATRFVERSGDGLSSVFSTIRHRFAATFHLMSAQPEAYIPMAGLLLSLWVLVARPEPFRSGLELAGPVWRKALLVIVLASLVAFVANDTGSTAAAPGLIYAAAGLAYPAFLASERRAAPT